MRGLGFYDIILKMNLILSILFLILAEISKKEMVHYLYIFDASGSMSSNISGIISEEDRDTVKTSGKGSKIEIAKKLFSESVKKLPSDVSIALIVFGNGAAGCDNIKFVSKFNEKTPSEIAKVVESFICGGKTPLAKTIRLAGDYIKEQKIETTVVLVTDGEEQCKGDPIESAAYLGSIGIEVKFFIVGLTVAEDIMKKLEEIAKKGGGRFVSVKSSDELKEVLEVTLSKISQYKINVLKLSAPVGQTIPSKILYTLRENEQLTCKFKPVRPAEGKGERSLAFHLSKIIIKLEEKEGSWNLYNIENDKRSEIKWPQTLKILKDTWNECKIIKKHKKITIVFNDNIVYEGDSIGDLHDINVSVTGYEAEFANLTITLPLD